MANISLGQRLQRGKVKSIRTSVAFPEDTLKLVKNIAVFKVRTPSDVIIQALELGLRQLAADNFAKGGQLDKEEIQEITNKLT